MKRWKLTNKDKEKLLEDFRKELDNYDGQEQFSHVLTSPAKDKIEIVFTPSAWLKCVSLVKEFQTEVCWHGLMKKLEARKYLVYDALVTPQTVSGARAIDSTLTNDWYEEHIDVIDDMHYQAHSHVNMSTTASGVDMEYQKRAVKNCQGHGFKLFQIWNKSGDINTFLYDLDENLVYDRNDVIISVYEEEHGTLKEFIQNAKTLVKDIVPEKKFETPKYKELYPEKCKELEKKYYWQEWPEEPETSKIKDPFYWKDETGKESY